MAKKVKKLIEEAAKKAQEVASKRGSSSSSSSNSTTKKTSSSKSIQKETTPLQSATKAAQKRSAASNTTTTKKKATSTTTKTYTKPKSYPLTSMEKTMTKEDQKKVTALKDQWWNSQGNTEKQRAVNYAANALRAKYGFSGGSTGVDISKVKAENDEQRYLRLKRTFADTPRNRWDNERTQNLDTTQKKIMAQDYSNLAKEYDVSAADRVNLAAKGALGQFLGGYQEDIGQYIKPENEYTPALTSRYVMEGDKEGLASARIEAQARQDAADKLYAMSSKNLQESAENIEAAKKGLSGAGKLLVDAGVAGSQMAADAALSALTGSPLGLVNMGTRVFGQSANEAREAGASDYQQLLYGLANAGVEVATERMFGAFKNTYGEGFLDNAMSKAIGKFVKSPAGAAFIKDTTGEGIEEIFASAVNPVLQSIYTGKAPNYSMDTLSEALYEGLVGSVLGAVGGGVNVLRNNRRATQGGTDTTTSPVNAQDLADRVQNTPVEAPIDITRMANNVVNQASPLDIRNLIARNGVSDMPTNAGSLGNPTPTNTNNIDTVLPVLEQNQTDIGKNVPILQGSNTQANTPITQANTQANTETNTQTNPLDLLRETARERAGVESGTSPVLLSDLVQRVDATESAKPVDVRGMAQRYANVQELANRAEEQREESANPIDIRSMAPQYVSLDDLKSRAKENAEQATPVDARKMTVQPVSTGSLVDRIKAKQSNQESGDKAVDIRSLVDVVKGSSDRVPASPQVTEQVESATPTNENGEYTTARGVRNVLDTVNTVLTPGNDEYRFLTEIRNIGGGKYWGSVKRKYYEDKKVEDSRDTIFGGSFNTREEAVEYITGLLVNNRFVENDLGGYDVDTVDTVKEDKTQPDKKYEKTKKESDTHRIKSGTMVETVEEHAENNTKEDDNNGVERPSDEEAVRLDAVLQQEAPGLLDGGKTGNVLGDEKARETDENPVQVRREADGHGSTDASGRDAGVRDGGSLERTNLLDTPANDFVIGESLNLPNGDVARFNANVLAIETSRKIKVENRFATPEEQEILSKFVGWGGLSMAFDRKPKDGWEGRAKQIKELLTPEEYKTAADSTQNAHYTSVEVIRAIYDGLRDIGFRGGRILEPSCGIGHFIGAMPGDLKSGVTSSTMVELDKLTGLIASELYPKSDVRVQGFQDSLIPDNYMDVAISNVPFGKVAIFDPAYPKFMRSSIHNYFFAKAIDKVRPGGIVCFITSRYTMDRVDKNEKINPVRKYIDERADLIGAIRLPDTAFKQNAKTNVITDIIVLKKRAPGEAAKGEVWLTSTEKPLWDENGRYIGNFSTNVYYDNHPEMVLGVPTQGTMYNSHSLSYAPKEGNLGDQIREAFGNITEKMEYPVIHAPESQDSIFFKMKKRGRKGIIKKKGDKFVEVNEDGTETIKEVSEKNAVRMDGIISIRDAARSLVEAQVIGNGTNKARVALNIAYDSFVEKFGPINSRTNKSVINMDGDSSFITSLEIYDKKTKTAEKSAIFYKDTISPVKEVTKVDNIKDGLIASINTRGFVDVPYISSILGASEKSVADLLSNNRLAFKTEDGGYEIAETYLSGNVKSKLKNAKALAEKDSSYKVNVMELERVIPPDIAPGDITAEFGSPWIPLDVYRQFILESAGLSYKNNKSSVTIEEDATGAYIVKADAFVINRSPAEYRVGKYTFIDFVSASLNKRTVKIYDDGKVDTKATEAARQIKERVSSMFRRWVWDDEERATELAKFYNEKFNAFVVPEYDGSKLVVNMMNKEYKLRPHQADAVQRIIMSGGNTLLAHRVGAGKTLEMAAAAMKLRELGIIKKPVFVVPKSLSQQWADDFLKFFPSAKILHAKKNDLNPKNRAIFTNRIMNGDYDAIIMTEEQFSSIQMSKEAREAYYQEQVDQLEKALNESKNDNLTVKNIRNRLNNLETKLKEIHEKKKDDDGATFEEIGIDSLFVDEAQKYKNLFYISKMNNVKDMGDKTGSDRSADMYMKTRYLQRLNRGRGLVFATATPVMNSAVELYTMQKYLQENTLRELGIDRFDDWCSQFGQVSEITEIDVSGKKYKLAYALKKYQNMPELQTLFRSFADVVTEIPGLEIPKIKGGKRTVVECEPSEAQLSYMDDLAVRAESLGHGKPRKGEDSVLAIYGDGKKISYSQKMADNELPNEIDGKIDKVSKNVYRIWKSTKKQRGTQLIFCDRGVPGGADEKNGIKFYEDIKNSLSDMGVPKEEVAFIHDADTDEKKQILFDKMRNGDVRILIGSYEKMSVGMNVQDRGVAIHELNVPPRPGDMEQAEGRFLRQGNKNKEVEIYAYITKKTFDSRSWDVLKRKAAFIHQLMNGRLVGRETEEDGELSVSAAEISAIATGNPLMLERFNILNKINGIESLYANFVSRQAKARKTKFELERSQQIDEEFIKNARKDIEKVQDISGDKFKMTVQGKTFDNRKEAGTALLDSIYDVKSENKDVDTFNKDVGYLPGGFNIRVSKTGYSAHGAIYKYSITTKSIWSSYGNTYEFSFNEGSETGTINSIQNTYMSGIQRSLETHQKWLDGAKEGIELAKKTLSLEFDQKEELDKLRERLVEINTMIENGQVENQSEDDGDSEVGEPSESSVDNSVGYGGSLKTGSVKKGTLKKLESISNRLGVRIVLEEGNGKTNGWYKDGVIHISVDADNPLVVVAKHELTHYIKEHSPKLYKEYRDYVMNALSKNKDYLIRMYQEDYSEFDQELTEDEAIDEIVADFTEALITDIDRFTELAEENRSLARRILDMLSDILYKIKRSLGINTQDAKESAGETFGMDANILTDAARLWDAALNGIDESILEDETNKTREEPERYSIIKDKSLLDFLNNQELVTVYRAMQVIDGDLYPPMAAKVKNKGDKSKILQEKSEKGVWYQSEERPDLIRFYYKKVSQKTGKKVDAKLTQTEVDRNFDILYNDKPGDIILDSGETRKMSEIRFKFNLDKGNGTDLDAAYAPYWHTSKTVLNDQFSSAAWRPNLVVVRGFIPKSEIEGPEESRYIARFAEKHVGETVWNNGPVADQLKDGDNARLVYLSRYFMVDEIVQDETVAKMIKDTIKGTYIKIPWNVVTPTVRRSLESIGVDIDYSDVKFGKKVFKFDPELYSLKGKNPLQRTMSSVGSSENRWQAERNGSAKSEVQRVSDVIEKIRHDFDIPISTGSVTGSRNVQGQYRQNANTIRTRHTNDLPTICHELGHKLDSEYGITKGSGFTKALSKEIRENLDQNFAANYAENRLDREGVAEFLRYFMEDVSKAEEAYPSFFWYFSDKVGQGAMRMLGNLADDINAIYSQDKNSVLSSMRRASDRGPDYRTKREKVSDAVNKAYQAVVDPMHALKTLDRALGTNTHMYAVNAAHVTATVEGLMDGDLYDFDGGCVSDGFYSALKDINMNQKSEEFNLFNEYLVVRHAPEVLAEGMDVFPDSDKNNIEFCLRRQAQLEAQYPQFEESAKRLYQFQRDLLRTWGVDTGLVSAEKYEEWGERWENYVPFNRHFSDREKREGAMRGSSARGGLANQNSTIRRMRGSTRDLQYPLDNIARNMAVLITAGYRNKVMSIIRDEILDSDSYGNFGEQIPPEKVPHRFNLEDIKQNIMDEGFGRFDAETYNELNELMNEHLPDILTQFSKKTAHGNIVTVMINGKTEYWKIHDPQLLDSVANLAPYRVAGVARAVSRTTRVMSGNLTGLNVLWGIFSNGPRDFASYLVYANKLNPFQRLTSFFSGVPQYYMSCISKSKASPLIRQYWAMGGGHGSSRYSADRNFTKDALRKFEGKKSYNPLDYLEFVADMIESGPRAAYFCALRKKGYSPQEAYYESNDITVNFWNTGKITKDVGIAVPFLGAGVKGVDKFVRYISADDVTGKNRKKVSATRVAGWMATSAIIAGICYALNMGDDDRKKDYFLLSNYVKNNRFNIPTGDGMYFSIPKPRELAVMASFFETLIERGQGNNHAFDEFYQYATSQLLPPLISDLASLNTSGLANSTGVIGVLYSIWANKDYLGNPIVSKSMQYLPAEKQYKNTTSILAYWLGQGTGVSPVVMDYAAKSILGGFATTFSSMFPVGGEDPKNAVAAAKSVPEKILKSAMPSGFMPNDKTFGIKGQYIKDNLYSNDVINRLYDKEEELKKDDTKSVEHKLVSNITSFWSEYNKRAKSLEANEKNRALRAEAVQTMIDFEKSFENNNFSNTMKKVMDIARRNDENEILPTAIKGTFQNDGEEVNLTADEFITYWKDYQGLYREKIGNIPFGDLNDTMSIKRAKKENDNAKKEAKNNILKMR